MNKQRILLVTERFWPEDFIINDVARQLVKDGFIVTVLTQAPSYPKGRLFTGYRNSLFSTEKWEGIEIIRFFTVEGYKHSLLCKLVNYLSFALTGSLVVRFLGKNFNKVFIYQTGPLSLAVPGLIAAKRCKIPVVIWTQDIWPDSVYAYGFKKTRILHLLLDIFVKWVYARCDEILISCEGFSERLKKFVPNKSFAFVPNYPVIDFYDGNYAKKGTVFQFIFTGNVGKVQNLDNVLKGFSFAQKKLPDFAKLVIVGDGSALSELKVLVRQYNIANVEFTGRLPVVAMPALLAESDVAIISLKDDPIFELTVPSKFQAYLSAGKPILCVMKGEVAQIVGKNDLGISVHPTDIEGIANAMLSMAENSHEGLTKSRTSSRSLLDSIYNRTLIIDKIETSLCSRGEKYIACANSHSHSPSIAILMGTYCGEKYLGEQLDSFLMQTFENWKLWASDDGSFDSTLNILKKYQDKCPSGKINIISGPRKGFAENFLSMACRQEIKADYYAFSDQDDIWNPEKLQRALNFFSQVPSTVPGLYCTRTRLVDTYNHPIGFSEYFAKAPSFSNALMQSIGGGNTMVFNEAARKLLVKAGSGLNVVTHDWWLYLVVSGCGGRVYYDSFPSLRYRQHEGNLVGMNLTWPARFLRIKMLMQGRYRDWNKRNIIALNRILDELLPENRKELELFASARDKWFIPRMIGLSKARIYRQTLLGNLGLIFAAIFKKI